ncbi:MAG: metalloregulator ArsR/SmtB family transcription factor [Methanothrix sp.]|nr:metalloregulator ArsR/SmtB family transcription factor [Methanothrix sp.]
MNQNELTASYLKALGHPVRLMIARNLLKGQMCVGEVVTSLNIQQANASQHLNILRINGIVESTREGTLKYYHLKEPKKIERLIKIMETYVH